MSYAYMYSIKARRLPMLSLAPLLTFEVTWYWIVSVFLLLLLLLAG
jgi:hypothetical protein